MKRMGGNLLRLAGAFAVLFLIAAMLPSSGPIESPYASALSISDAVFTTAEAAGCQNKACYRDGRFSRCVKETGFNCTAGGGCSTIVCE